MEEETTEDKILSVSAPLFVYATLATLLVSIVCAASLLVFSVYSVHRERDLALQLATHSELLSKCNTDQATLAGRVRTFESLFIHSKMTAIQSALREFIDHANMKPGKLTVEQYQEWLRER